MVAWSGMRGPVSLAVALALPLTRHAGRPFPARDLIIFLTFAVSSSRSSPKGYEHRSLAYQHLIQLVLWAQRDALLQMRRDRTLSNEVMNTIVRELDLEESRLEIAAAPPSRPAPSYVLESQR